MLLRNKAISKKPEGMSVNEISKFQEKLDQLQSIPSEVKSHLLRLISSSIEASLNQVDNTTQTNTVCSLKDESTQTSENLLSNSCRQRLVDTGTQTTENHSSSKTSKTDSTQTTVPITPCSGYRKQRLSPRTGSPIRRLNGTVSSNVNNNSLSPVIAPLRTPSSVKSSAVRKDLFKKQMTLTKNSVCSDSESSISSLTDSEDSTNDSNPSKISNMKLRSPIKINKDLLKRKYVQNKSKSYFSPPPKRRNLWSNLEEEKLWKGVQQFGVGNWAKIKTECKLNERSNVNIKDKYRTWVKNNMLDELSKMFSS